MIGTCQDTMARLDHGAPHLHSLSLVGCLGVYRSMSIAGLSRIIGRVLPDKRRDAPTGVRWVPSK